MSDIKIVLCTFPEAVVARQIGTVLVEKQLAACVNLIPAVESIYLWQGHLETATEVLAIFKTSTAMISALERELAALHPYAVPEIVTLDPASVAAPYAAWVLAQVIPTGLSHANPAGIESNSPGLA